jgi:two-component sensor histidine kinase
MLAREVDHRAKNALAVVQALITLTTAPTKEAFIAAVRGRVTALARAHSLLAQNRWKGADLVQIITDETAAYQKPGQIVMSGPTIMVEPDAVQPLSLIVHELATNAVKYGALSAAEGKIELDWRIMGDGRLRLVWRESGGPAVARPSSTGFGSTLITTVGAKQLGGDIDVRWLAKGVEVRVILPKESYRTHDSAPAGEVPIATPPVTSPLEGRLLLVEDEALVALEMSRAMTDSGWEVMGPAGSRCRRIGCQPEWRNGLSPRGSARNARHTLSVLQRLREDRPGRAISSFSGGAQTYQFCITHGGVAARNRKPQAGA